MRAERVRVLPEAVASALLGELAAGCRVVVVAHHALFRGILGELWERLPADPGLRLTRSHGRERIEWAGTGGVVTLTAAHTADSGLRGLERLDALYVLDDTDLRYVNPGLRALLATGHPCRVVTCYNATRS